MPEEFVPRPLHLHTIDSLCADLISGRPVATTEHGDLYQLKDDQVRKALQWYRTTGVAAWAGPVSVAQAEELVDAIDELPTPPDTTPLSVGGRQRKILTLKRLEAHRFAGLHCFGTPQRPPRNFVLDFSAPLQLFEGANGSGKTSLVNALIWALTGDILRPQREPESGLQEFFCRIDLPQPSHPEPTTHKTSAVTPLPNPQEYRPDKAWVHADTWVELTFIDETGQPLPPIRRSLFRTPGGKIQESLSGLTSLGLDPIAFRIGTLMPGLLPLIRVGSESELGTAVTQLTGLSALVQLSDHVRRARNKIDKEFVKRETEKIERFDQSYNDARSDLLNEIDANTSIRLAETVPLPSADPGIASVLDRISADLLAQYSISVSGAKQILGDSFDPNDKTLRTDLENNIGAALSEVRQLRLDSLARLKNLRTLTPEDLQKARTTISNLIHEARTLHALSQDPSREARLRLYALLALWIEEHPQAQGLNDLCPVCGTLLQDRKDPVTGQPIKDHVHDAQSNASLISQTLHRWAQAALGNLAQSLLQPLRREMELDGPHHPCDLIRTALTEELFGTTPFKGVLRALKASVDESMDTAVKDAPSLPTTPPLELPSDCAELQAALISLDRGISFAEWRRAHDPFCTQLFANVIGRISTEADNTGPRTLAGKLSALHSMVKSVAPLTRAMTFCDRLQADLIKRRTAEKRIATYGLASTALAQLLPLGNLADLQVARLRAQLRVQAAKWRDSVYQAGFPAAAHSLLDTKTTSKGHLELIVGSNGISAPAHYITNASALRASLVGFYLAFWEYVLNERGGLRLIILDDPEELFDEVNRERLGETLPKLVEVGAQLVVTTHDRRFAGYVSRLRKTCNIEHRSVHPATALQGTVRTPLTAAEIDRKKAAFDADPDSEQAAQDYAGACRVHIETMLSDLFDDPGYSAWVTATPAPTFNNYVERLRGQVRTSPNGMCSSTAFSNFVNHPAVAPTSPTCKLLNKPHHQDRRWITPAEVIACNQELSELVDFTDKMHEERRMWRHRSGQLEQTVSSSAPVLESLESLSAGQLQIPVCPDLAAFTHQSLTGESQEPLQYLDPVVFESKALFQLQRDNFGFAAPQGSIALVKTEPSAAADRSLVIARDGTRIYARRVLRGDQPGWISLAGETPNPKHSPRTRSFQEDIIALHEVVGILFSQNRAQPRGPDEATPVNDPTLLEGIEIAYRVKDDSAIPLVLPKQIALGGHTIPLDSFAQHIGDLVALLLDDHSSIFKRAGPHLPGDLRHLREFESIGGLGSSRILAVDKPHLGLRSVVQARLIVGVLYSS